MSINDDFYSKFPSLNSNSKENLRYKRISREYENYIKNTSPQSPPKTKTQQRIIRSRLHSEESSPGSDQSRMDIIFSAEDRNRYEDEQIKNRQKIYQNILKNQIQEQRIKKQKEQEKRKWDEMILEQRLQRQLESIKLQRDPPQADKIVERVSVSENEKDSYNDSKLSKHDNSISSNNDVYRYFSKSAKADVDLYNYRKYFTDVMLEHSKENSLELEYPETRKVIRNNELALRKLEYKKKPEIDSCPSCSPPACSRCHKKLEIYCNDCTSHVEKASPEIPKRLEIEYNEPELPFANQQVVIYRSTDQHAPYSFNIEPNSVFNKDKLEDMQKETERKFANYMKNYGSLKKKKMQEEEPKKIEAQPVYTGTIPKWKSLIQDNLPPKHLTFTPDDVLAIDEALTHNNAQNTVITHIGFAKRQLELEKLKS